MNLLLVGGGADAVNVRYACGFTAPDPFLFLQKGAERHLLVSMLELGRATALGEGVHCHTADSLGLKAAARKSLGKQAAGLIKHLGLKQISVSPVCPVGLVKDLEKAGLRVQVMRKPLFPERLLKNEEEIRHLRASQRAAVSAMKAAFDCIRESRIDKKNRLLQADGSQLTSEILRRKIEVVLLEADCVAEEIIVAGGDQGVDPHERGHGPLYAGQWIVLDIFPQSKVSGYWGDITRTVMKGRPSPEQKHQYQTVLKAQKNALSQVKPGVSGKEIHEEICRQFVEAGFETGLIDGVPQGFIHSTGHGVGLEIHEAPSVSPLGGPLEVGQVITIEPGLYYKGLGGVRIEDTVVVTEKGCSILARCSKDAGL
ncbi:Xaa-Pro peptidase family protein [Kiritimatiellaeota bacterium B1221]|nr:Xaa-Pro peptidase family protein [Kiritimatiellaeota bacterium B1221]